ncbi:MAG: hypothetical protein LBM93_01000 [Oscillospiraceae bacterium]|nr:hypothetical protein [Oscillospiraceae bacterium]
MATRFTIRRTATKIFNDISADEELSKLLTVCKQTVINYVSIAVPFFIKNGITITAENLSWTQTLCGATGLAGERIH